MEIKIKKLKENAIIPTYGTEYSAGADLSACLDESVTINPHFTMMIGTGVAMEIPVGYAGLIYARSGLACKQGLAPANKVGVADSDYRGEIIVALHNHSDEPKVVNPQDRIAQLVITPYVTGDFKLVDNLNETVRADGKFGSTGR